MTVAVFTQLVALLAVTATTFALIAAAYMVAVARWPERDPMRESRR